MVCYFAHLLEFENSWYLVSFQELCGCLVSSQRSSWKTFGSHRPCGQLGNTNCSLYLLLLVSLEVEPGQDWYEAGFPFLQIQALGIGTALVMILGARSRKVGLMWDFQQKACSALSLQLFFFFFFFKMRKPSKEQTYIFILMVLMSFKCPHVNSRYCYWVLNIRQALGSCICHLTLAPIMWRRY